MKEDAPMNILKSNKGFTLVEMLLALALMGIVSVATAALLVTGIKIISNSTKVINNTNTAAGQIENWYADNTVASTPSGTFRVDFSNKGTYVSQGGQYITGKDSTGSATVKAFEPDNAMTEPIHQEIICKDTLSVNANLFASTSMMFYVYKTSVLPGKTVSTNSTSFIYTQTDQLNGYINFFHLDDNYRSTYTPIPVTANTTYVDYNGSSISFDVSNDDKYYYVNNFVVSQDGTITVTNNSTSNKKRSVFIYIKGSFSINSAKQLQINITGTNSSYTSLFFVYSGNQSIYLDGNTEAGNTPSYGINCNIKGCYIYAPSSDVSIISNGISGVIAANLHINGNTTFLPVNDATKPNWKELVMKLIGS